MTGLDEGAYRPWRGGAVTEALAAAKAVWYAEDRACVLCGKFIDYSLRHPDEEACTIEHIAPRRERPDLIWDPMNWAPAHSRCNKRRLAIPQPEAPKGPVRIVGQTKEGYDIDENGDIGLGIHTPFPPDRLR